MECYCRRLVKEQVNAMSLEITDFAKDVLERSHAIPVLVDFWAEWCGPCRVLGPVLEHVAGEYKDRFELVKVDTDRYQDVAAQYGVRGIPSVKLFVDGKVVNEFTGALPENVIVQWLERALPGKFRKDLDKAAVLIAAGDVEPARALLENIVREEPGNDHARVLLAGTYVESDLSRANDLVQGIEEYSEHFDTVYAIRTMFTLISKLRNPDSLPDDGVKDTYLAGIRGLSQRDYDGALGKFIEVIRSNRYYDDDGSRKACIAMFKILGDEHEITRSRRRDFSSALNS